MIGVDILLSLLLADEPLRAIDHAAVRTFIESRRTDRNGAGKILVTSGGDYNGDSIADKLVLYTYEHGPKRGDKVYGLFAVAFISETGGFCKATEVLFVPETELVAQRLLEYSSRGNETMVTAEKRLPGDAMCCPSGIATVTFSVRDGKVVILKGEFQRRPDHD